MSTKDYTKKKGVCRICKRETDWALHNRIFINHSQNFTWVCQACKLVHPGNDNQPYIKAEIVREFLSDEQIDALPVIIEIPEHRCARCGKRGAELHHWAPQAVFEDAHTWPKDYLCRDCHTLWHKIVTPGTCDP